MVLDDLELLALTQKLGQQKLQTPWVAPSLGGQSIPKPTFDFGKVQLPPTGDKGMSMGAPFFDKISKAWGGIGTKAKELVTPFEKGTTGVKTGGEYLTKQLQTPIGRGTALMALLTAATELADERDPFQKNLAEGLGLAGGSIGGAYGGAAIGANLGLVGGPAGSLIGALIGSMLMSQTGKQLASGAYRAVNPRGELEHAIRRVEKQGDLMKASEAIQNQIARTKAMQQADLDRETATLNYILR